MSRSSCRTSPSPLRPQPHPALPRHLPTLLSQPEAATARRSRPRPPCLTHSHFPLFSLTPSHNSGIKLRVSSSSPKNIAQIGWPPSMLVRLHLRSRPLRLLFLLVSAPAPLIGNLQPNLVLLCCSSLHSKVIATPARPAAFPARRPASAYNIMHFTYHIRYPPRPEPLLRLAHHEMPRYVTQDPAAPLPLQDPRSHCPAARTPPRSK